MSDSYLDALIEAALKTDAIVTPRQKQRAWERLEQRAAQQTIWPPLVEPKKSLVGTLRLAFTHARRCLAILLVDEGSYERARKERWDLGSYSIRSASSPHVTLESSPYVRSQM
jgi:hypothetical protein